MKWTVSKADKGIKLVAFLKGKLGEGHSSRNIKKSIETNNCRINGYVERFASTKLNESDIIEYVTEDVVEQTQKVEVEEERILYDDETLLIYDKPTGLTSDKAGLGKLFPNYYLVHRLDRDTTGVIIFAKHQQIHEKLVATFRSFRVQKEYLALVLGVPRRRKGHIENYLGKISWYEGQSVYGEVPDKKGKYAKTEWNLEKRGKGICLLKCLPITGRTHQIRTHLASIKHPILGDYQYARDTEFPFFPKRCLLHSRTVTFPHPITGRTVTATAPMPKDFKRVMKELF